MPKISVLGDFRLIFSKEMQKKSMRTKQKPLSKTKRQAASGNQKARPKITRAAEKIKSPARTPPENRTPPKKEPANENEGPAELPEKEDIDLAELDEDLEFLVDPADITDDSFTDVDATTEEIDNIADEQIKDVEAETDSEAEDDEDSEGEAEDEEDSEGEAEDEEEDNLPDSESRKKSDQNKPAKNTAKKAKASTAANSLAKTSAQEWTCHGCFMKVIPSQFGPADNPVCPIGESICPAIKKFF